MDTKAQINELLSGANEAMLEKLLDYIKYLKYQENKKITDEVMKLSESSLSFWNNEIDDEVWNNV